MPDQMSSRSTHNGHARRGGARPADRRRRHRHRARRVPRPPGPARRQAGDRALLPRPRARRTADRGVQLPPRGRRRHDAAPGLRVRELGARATATSAAGPTSRRCARSRGSRRPRSCSATSSTRRPASPVEVSPRRILHRQVERAAALGYTVMCGVGARVLPVPRVATRRPRRRASTDLTPHSQVIEDYHILQTTRDEYLIRADPQRHRRRGHPGRVLEGRGRPRPARDQPAVRRRAEMADRHVDLQERREGDRRLRRPRRSRSWRSTRWTRSARRATCTRACGTPTATKSLMWERRRARPHVAGVPRLARRPDRARPRARVDVRPDGQLLQALPARVVGADRARVGRRQPHVRLPGRRPRPGVPGRVAHPRRRLQPVPRVRGDDRGRAARHRARHRAAARASTATRTRRTDLPHVPWNIVDAIDEFETSEVADDAFGADVHHHLVNTATQEWAALQPGGHRLGAPPQLRAVLSVTRRARSIAVPAYPLLKPGRIDGWLDAGVAVPDAVRRGAAARRRAGGGPARRRRSTPTTRRRCSTTSTACCCSAAATSTPRPTAQEADTRRLRRRRRARRRSSSR